MDVSNKKTKRASVSFDQPRTIVDDDAKAKIKYQTLLTEYLELQKAFVSSKRKLQAAKQKRETVLSEVRFLRRKRKYLSKTRNEDAPENFDQAIVSCSSSKNEEAHENKPVNEEKNIRLTKKPKNRIIHEKGTGKRKISWPDQVTLQV
ncbi:hypothetical protein ABFS82_01G035000 [Erythranthe guttata]|uniref:Uncharacterized protein n=1 Tax=Erythranthe guttata TaxID=4155 RepID=A0A022Q470_ERYGU|nr:PREDICTED: uncharacterized protein LOC105975346 [Erythranthe guttata]EYU21998.1 hypothetical protein MIMGU_mgv1a015746mg [Erythranthe guttata]|eukprot:XP_012855990.1 PREDICTED: uncharacterized protein LOC105975346 [Erythranthe guttata]